MKKILGLGLIMSSIVFAEDFNLDTEIKGEMKKTYEIKREILDEVKEVSPESKDIIGLENLNDVKIDTIKGEIEEVELKIDDYIDLGLEMEKEIDEIDMLIEEAESDNYVKIGVGGFDKLDSFMYGINYSNELKEYELDYKINLERNIRGEDKEHSDISKDHFGAEVNYKDYKVALEHNIKDQEYIGGGDRKLSETELNLKYEIKNNPDNSAYAGFDFYRAGSESTSDRRDYENLYFNLYGEYDKLFTQDKFSHILVTKGGYYLDNIESIGTNVLYGVVEDKVKHEDYKNYQFNLNAGLEVVNKDVEVNNTGLNLGVEAVRKLNDNLNVSLFFIKEDRNQTTKEIMNGLPYADDILMFQNSSNNNTELKVENNLALGGSVNYTEESFYSEAILRYISSKNKINYQQTNLGTEKVITASNYNDTLKWMEVEGKAAYSINEFRGEILAKYQTLDKLAYVPKFNTTLSGIYDKEKVRAQVDFNSYSKMYSQVEGVANRYELSGYTTVDFVYMYRFSSLIEGSAIITNILNADKETMENYKIDERKITLECKVKY